MQIESLKLRFDGSEIALKYGGRKVTVNTGLVGRFNAKNILGVATLAYGWGTMQVY